MTVTQAKPKFSVEEFRASLAESNQELTKASGTRPFCQVINPQRGVSNAPMGLFIPLPQAEAVGFVPGGSWVEHTQTFASGSKEPGFITSAPRFVIIQRSVTETYETAEIGDSFQTVYRGPTFHKQGGIIDYQPARSGSTFKSVTRYLLLFLDDENQPLHETPLQLSAARAFGSAFGEEVSTFVADFTPASNKLFDKKGTLTPLGLSKWVIQMILGSIDPGKGQAPYTAPVGRFKPVFVDASDEDKDVLMAWIEEGKTVTASRNKGKRSVELTTALVQDFILFPTSETGLLAAQLVADNTDFPKPPGKDEAPADEFQDIPQAVAPAATQDAFQGAGTFDITQPTFMNDGRKLVLPFKSPLGNFQAVFLAEKNLVDFTELTPLAGKTYHVEGPRQGGYLRVDSMKFIDEVPF